MTKRCFIAVNLPETAKNQLAELVAELKKTNSSRLISYVRTESLHLTLHFLGDINDEQIRQVEEILKNIENFEATSLVTAEIEAFPSLRNPRVIFLECREEKNVLPQLQRQIGQELEKIGIETDQRPWRIHLTLARIKGLLEFKVQNLKIPPLKIPVESLELMESQLKPSGAEYKIINSYNLKHET